jgi:uncharacterized membrane protein YkvA (DUF1232 family)
MSGWLPVATAAAGGLVLLWLGLLAALALAGRHHDRPALREALRLLPDILRLLRRLATDRDLPRGIRVRLLLVLAYLLLPVDLVPDFLPGIGYLDDAVVVALVLRAVVRAAGPGVVAAHWPGTPAGLALLHRLTGAAS